MCVVEAPKPRALWIDAARALMIVLVVLGHVVNGLLDAHLLSKTSFWGSFYALLHTVRMPSLFLISGLFVQKRLIKGVAKFLREIGNRIVWPYLLWGTVQLLVIWLLSSYVNRPVTIDAYRILSLPWAPPSQFWFLQALAGFHVLAIVSMRLRSGSERGAQSSGNSNRGLRALIAVAVVLVVAKMTTDLVWGMSTDKLYVLYGSYPYYLLFYVLGVAVGPVLLQPHNHHWRHVAVVFILASAVWLWAATQTAAYAEAEISLIGLVATASGLLACIALAHARFFHSLPFIAYIGKHSLSVLVLHVFFVAGLRIFLSQFLGWTEPVSLMVMALCAGVGGPLVVFHFVDRWRWSKRLGLS